MATSEVNNNSTDSGELHTNITDLPSNQKFESRVLVIYTGGTIGMVPNNCGVLVPMSNVMEKKFREDKELNDETYANNLKDKSLLVLPDDHQMKRRVLYRIREYSPLLDSCNMSMKEWSQLANDIMAFYEEYDGFVILQGTDTLAYTASALSFMLENLGKSVIITGSQISIFQPRSDGRDNFYAALVIAGNYCVPEVSVYFGDKLLRGNRTMKTSSDSFQAFDSPNYPPLVTVGIHFEVHCHEILLPNEIQKFSVHSELNKNIAMLRIYPNMNSSTMRAFLQPPIKGVVLQTYGAGNVPSNRPDLIAELKEATGRGIVIVNCTQCPEGSVEGIYETGWNLLDAGVIQGMDMTAEAAFTKLSYVLSKEQTYEKQIKMMAENLRGEFTVPTTNCKDSKLLLAVAKTLGVSVQMTEQKLRQILSPELLISAVLNDDVEMMEKMVEQGVNVTATNGDYRTALHIACAEGKTNCVKFLIEHGASVHQKDRFNRTPLLDAIQSDSHDIIRLLMDCGGHLQSHDTNIGNYLCTSAATGNLLRLQSFSIAKADLNSSDFTGRTPLLVAVLHKQKEVIQYLIRHGCCVFKKDIAGNSPLKIAKQLGLSDILK